MITIKQAVSLLAQCFGMDESPIQAVRDQMVAAGMLPKARGRNIPVATPERVALLILGMVTDDLDRINDLADIRRADTHEDPPSLQDFIALFIHSIMANPDLSMPLNITLTTSGSPWASVRGTTGHIADFGGVDDKDPLIRHVASISMAPLTRFVNSAHAMAPPYRVT